MLDENLRNSELWHSCHDACVLVLHVTPEKSVPVNRVEKSRDNTTPHCFLDALQSRSSSQKFVQPQALVIIDDLVVSQNHQKGRERNAPIMMA
jgi:hypothetical protein